MSAGGSHSLATATDGSLFSFGSGGHGRLGHGDTADRYRPNEVKALQGTRVRHAEASRAHSIILTETGAVLTFGQPPAGDESEHSCYLNPNLHLNLNLHPNLNLEGDESEQLLPTAVQVLGGDGPDQVESLAAGTQHTVLLLASGELRTFGRNE